MPAFTYVDQPVRIVPQLADMDRLGVDTEFMRERTFLSQLCLVQVSGVESIWCVDPLSGHSMDEFWASLSAKDWVVHSARQDLEVIYQTTGRLPQSLFDTQVAAALLGFQPQLGYAGLVNALFDVELPKSHTRANWSRRPLPDEYLDYAAEDVEYLLPAHEELAKRLEDKGRLEWALADSKELLDPALYEINPDTAIERLKGARNFRGTRFAAAANLAAWRETEALRRNLPRQWILRDTVLTDIAYRLPESSGDLAAIDSLPPKLVKRSGEHILALVNEARSNSNPARTNPFANGGRPDEQQKSVLKKMQGLVADCAAELDVAAETIASKKELSAILLRGDRDSRVFSGWRKTLIGDRVAELL